MTVLILAGLLGAIPALLNRLSREHLSLLANPPRKGGFRRSAAAPRCPQPQPRQPSATPQMMSPARFAALGQPRKEG